jgi:hypothetical protein
MGSPAPLLATARKAGVPAGRGKTGADAPPLSFRLRFLSQGRCHTVFSLCFLLLLIPLLCCNCFYVFLFLKVKGTDSVMAPFGSPGLPASV